MGTEIVTPYAIACLLVALESRLRLAAGIEITAYPVANLEAHRETVFLPRRSKSMACAAGKIHNAATFGCLSGNSSATLTTQFSSLRQNPRALDADVEAWLAEEAQKIVLSDALKALCFREPSLPMEGEPGPSDLQPHFHPDPQLGAPARRDHYRPSGGANTGTAGSGKHGIDSESIARDAPGSRRGA